MNLSKMVKVSKVIAAQAAGTGTTNGTTLDMQGFEGVMFVGGAMGTADAGNYFKLQQGEQSDLSDAADLEGTKVTPGDNGDAINLDLYRPQERYVRVVAVRGASSTLGDVYAIQYTGRKPPISDDSAIDGELHVSPDEGTA
jgi:hypothetical protein